MFVSAWEMKWVQGGTPYTALKFDDWTNGFQWYVQLKEENIWMWLKMVCIPPNIQRAIEI